ncbi:unnamed protein product [Pleuronectes platessa]|uniref:Uncharacterized protein n=1 Tax=Pleuronectes platessa TaxID=8262 RepID=A0A9N7UWS5_PLEPL|nr:unnamed protein product [Pleuronectes platessa]
MSYDQLLKEEDLSDFARTPQGLPDVLALIEGNFNLYSFHRPFSLLRTSTRVPPGLPDKNDVIPLRSKKNPLLFGPANAAATEEPAPLSLSGHDYSLDFRNIRATRACNTVKVTSVTGRHFASRNVATLR